MLFLSCIILVRSVAASCFCHDMHIVQDVDKTLMLCEDSRLQQVATVAQQACLWRAILSHTCGSEAQQQCWTDRQLCLVVGGLAFVPLLQN